MLPNGLPRRISAADAVIAHTTPHAVNWISPRKSFELGTVATLAAFGYVVLLGGTAVGEMDPVLRAVNAVVGVAFVAVYVLRIASHTDRLDRRILLTLLLFAGASVASAFPRQSLDALLAALTYVAALYVARSALRSEGRRVALVQILIGLSAVMTALTAARWLPTIIEWWAIADWRTIPPLNLNLGGQPWGHRHDLALLVAMLYPSWWIGHPSTGRRVVAVLFGVLALLVVVVDGSRTLWIALFAATSYQAIPWIIRRWRTRRGMRVALIVLLVVIAISLLVTGLGAALVQRATNVASIEARAAMWGPLIDLWLAHPVTGEGPGSFPWLLQLTGYFDTNSWAPRHPDSVIVQLLAEAGILGAAGLVVLVSAVLPAIVRGRSASARWALMAFAMAGLAANPTDFAFLVAVAIAWTAYAVPHGDVAANVQRAGRRSTTAALACVGVVAIAYGTTLAAAFSYQRAGAYIASAGLADALPALNTAVALDPGMAIYVRQRGALHLLLDDAGAAARDLKRAVTLNPADDLGWRSLALAHARTGDRRASEDALARAVDLQRSDSTNLLLRAALETQGGQAAEAAHVLAELVHAWPILAFAPGWEELVPPPIPPKSIVDAALLRWQQDVPIPELPTDQGVWLATMAGQPGVLDAAITRSPFSPEYSEGVVAAIRCSPRAASIAYTLTLAEPQNALAWLLRLRASVHAEPPDREAVRMGRLMGYSISSRWAGSRMNPLNENGSFSADTFGYRRPPIQWPTGPVQLPSQQAGMTRWLLLPAEAVEGAGLEDRLAECD